MPSPRVELTASAQRELRKLPAQVQDRILEELTKLERGARVDVKKLKGHRSTYRLRVGEHRGIFERQGDAAIFTRFAHRSTVYDA